MVPIQFNREFSHKTAVFLLTFFSYALFHANRKAFSNVKTSTGNVWTPSPHNKTYPEVKPDITWNSHNMFEDHDDVEKYQGYLDTAFMLAYAAGLFINGYVGDRVDMRLLLTLGMGSTSVLIFVFGCVCEFLGFYNKYFYMVIWIVNGLAQSTGWPVVVACMGNWFGHGSRGLLLGLWSSCASVGNIIGALMVSSVLHYGYEYAFLTTSTALLCGTFCIFFGLVPSPKDVGLEEPKDKAPDVTESRYRSDSRHSHAENDGSVGAEKTGHLNDGFTTSLEDPCGGTKAGGGGGGTGTSTGTDTVTLKHGPTTNGHTTVINVGGTVKDSVKGTVNGTGTPSAIGPVAVSEGQKVPEKVPEVKVEPLLSDGGMTSDEESFPDPMVERSGSTVVYEIETTKPALSFLEATLLPGVIPYSLAYAFLKLVNYSFFFWLPLYLHKAFGWEESLADQLSTVYDVAGIVGGTLSGFISDRIGKRSIIVVPMLLLSVPSLFIYNNSPNDQVINAALMAVIGFFIGGSANLISAAVSADLGCQKALSGDDRALSTVTGVIDGSGSFGAALGQIAVPYLQLGLGWHSVFYMFMICMFLTACCLWPLFIKELRSFPCCARIMWCGGRGCANSDRASINNDRHPVGHVDS